MATMANIIKQMERNVRFQSLSSTEVQPLIRSVYGHHFGVCNMTAPETILTAATGGNITVFAAFAMVWSVNTVATSTCTPMMNQGTSSAPNWVATHSVAN
jgi:hypothetical protein